MTAQVAYCSDMDKSVIIANMEKRGWVAVGPEDEWQFYWASTQTCRCVKYLHRYFLNIYNLSYLLQEPFLG